VKPFCVIVLLNVSVSMAAAGSAMFQVRAGPKTADNQ
jgi:hypothetical protein